MPNYKKYIGKTVLVGISVFSHDDELLDRYQYFGEIVSIDDVISIKTDDGEIATLPPDLKSLKKAQKDATFYQVIGAHHGGREFWTNEVLDIEEKFIRRLCQ